MKRMHGSVYDAADDGNDDADVVVVDMISPIQQTTRPLRPAPELPREEARRIFFGCEDDVEVSTSLAYEQPTLTVPLREGTTTRVDTCRLPCEGEGIILQQQQPVPPRNEASGLSIDTLRVLAKQQEHAYEQRLREIAMRESRLDAYEERLRDVEQQLLRREDALRCREALFAQELHKQREKQRFTTAGGGDISFQERLRLASSQWTTRQGGTVAASSSHPLLD